MRTADAYDIQCNLDKTYVHVCILFTRPKLQSTVAVIILLPFILVISHA